MGVAKVHLARHHPTLAGAAHARAATEGQAQTSGQAGLQNGLPRRAVEWAGAGVQGHAVGHGEQNVIAGAWAWRLCNAHRTLAQQRAKCCRKTPAFRLGIYPALPRAKVRAMHQSAQALALSAEVRIK
jgi:hypothetical protein